IVVCCEVFVTSERGDHGTASEGQKKVRALARVAAATASSGSWRAPARAAPTAGRKAGSLVLPRWGAGARNGASVSPSRRWAGGVAAAARRSSAVLEETIPEYDS